MNRRLFVGQCAAGLALPFVSFPTFSKNSSQVSAPARFSALQQAADLIQKGQLGTLQSISISTIYSPSTTSLSGLQRIARQDVALLAHLLGAAVPIDTADFFAPSPSTPFGSYSARIAWANVQVTWQGLARTHNPQQNPNGKMILLGDKGGMEIDTQTQTYSFFDFQRRKPLSV